MGSSYLQELLAVLLPKGGIAVMLHAGFDESGTHDGSPVACVAGYIFKSDQLWRFENEWREAFGEIQIIDRYRLGESLIGMIKRRAETGIVVSACEDVGTQYRPPGAKLQGSSDVLCLQWCMVAIAGWLAKYHITEPLALFFEASHRQQSLSNSAMDWLLQTPVLCNGLNYSSHTFVMRRAVRSIQAADLLAWEFGRRIGAIKQDRRSGRSSVTNLLGLPHYESHLDEAGLKALIAISQGEKSHLREFESTE